MVGESPRSAHRGGHGPARSSPCITLSGTRSDYSKNGTMSSRSRPD